MKNPRSFLLRTLALGAPILLCLIVVNASVDSAHLLDSSLEKELLNPILRGRNLTNLQNFDDREFNRQVIKSTIHPRSIVLGSSRSLQVRCDSVKGSFFNHSLYGATLEDIVAIYQLYKESGKELDMVLIDAEPWYFNKNREESRWKVFEQQVENFKGSNVQPGESDSIRRNLSVYSELISPSYFQMNIKSIGKSMKVEVTDRENNEKMTRLFDGSVTYGTEYLNSIDKAKVTMDRIPMLEDYFEANTEDIALFERLVKDMIENGIEVRLLMFPYHPDVYKKIKSNSRYSIVSEVEDYYRKLAKSLGIRIDGSFDPEPCGLTASDFMDFSHLQNEGVRKLLRNSQ